VNLEPDGPSFDEIPRLQVTHTFGFTISQLTERQARSRTNGSSIRHSLFLPYVNIRNKEWRTSNVSTTVMFQVDAHAGQLNVVMYVRIPHVHVPVVLVHVPGTTLHDPTNETNSARGPYCASSCVV
jgi:hypothetical protein